ncbi:DUF732 domain-containing protein [Mycobacterium scrofulaceum]|uniref:DUF732 domain-containing protein n=1 Tax=Mycobacterium scrofulaceum TaxID=1783 RepID=A0A1X0K549_MYCSC|nr:DUF732 domain-containing protein [Mycobacterium scrofulaceum]ORB70138.1 hypothetical protein BST44_24115 [Mycobacterium scrofulaceum]
MVTRLLLATGLALIGLLAAVPIAHADTTDDAFVAKLKAQGIGDKLSPTHEIEAGHFVCVKLDNGATPMDVMEDVMKSSGLPEFHSGYFVGASIDAYCPRHKGEVPEG